MPWEEKDEYAVTLINQAILNPQLSISVDWPEKLSSFVLQVTQLGSTDTTYPCDMMAEAREARYKVYLQGTHEGQVFWAPLGHYLQRRYTIPQEVGEVLWQIYKDFDSGETLELPQLKVICPTDSTVLLRSTRLGYKH
jgi:hypothetical protein